MSNTQDDLPLGHLGCVTAVIAVLGGVLLDCQRTALTAAWKSGRPTTGALVAEANEFDEAHYFANYANAQDRRREAELAANDAEIAHRWSEFQIKQEEREWQRAYTYMQYWSGSNPYYRDPDCYFRGRYYDTPPLDTPYAEWFAGKPYTEWFSGRRSWR
jgi:hypothetical protein